MQIGMMGLGRMGGNMDIRDLAAGTVLYLPVEVEGDVLLAGWADGFNDHLFAFFLRVFLVSIKPDRSSS